MESRMRRKVFVRFREEKPGNSSTTPHLLLYCQLGKAGCMWASSSTCSPAASSIDA